MRAVIWFILLFGAAVVASSTLGANDGLVSVASLMMGIGGANDGGGGAAGCPDCV